MQAIFANKVVLITGASSGIGKALAEALLSRKAIVYNADIKAPTSSTFHYFPLDVSNYEAFHKVVKEILQRHQRLDMLINNAGIGIAGEMQDLDITVWKRAIDTNLFGVINGSKIAYEIMIKQGFGHIVNMASMAALIPFPLAVPYATTKYAVLGLSKSLRIEGARLGVKVTAVCPGFVESSLYENAIKAHTTTEKIKSTIPFPIISTEKAVSYILRGIAHNKSVVVFPFYTRFAMWLERLFPNLLAKWVLQKTVNEFRKNKG